MLRSNFFRTACLVVAGLILVSLLAVAWSPARLGVASSGATPTRPTPNHELAADQLLNSARLAGDYLARQTRDDGRFIYRYNAQTDRMVRDYNILRHAGTTYSMFELYKHTGDKHLREAATRAVDYLVGQVHPWAPEAQTQSVVVEGDDVKLGGAGLALVALAEYTRATGDEQHLPVMVRLARWIQGQIAEDDGRFIAYKYKYPSLERTDFVSLYYNGEAMLGLMRLYELTGDESLVDSCEAAARYLITIRDGGLSDDELPPDHWLLYALNELHAARPKDLYLDHALRIAHAMVRTQLPDDTHPRAWAGGWGKPPRSTPAACRTEGLGAAYRLARRAGRLSDAAAFRLSIDAGVRFQLRTQIRERTQTPLRNHARALGAFRESLDGWMVQIDYVQHNLSSIISLYEIVRETR